MSEGGQGPPYLAAFGTPEISRGGLTLAPSQVYLAGILSPSPKTGLEILIIFFLIWVVAVLIFLAAFTPTGIVAAEFFVFVLGAGLLQGLHGS